MRKRMPCRRHPLASHHMKGRSRALRCGLWLCRRGIDRGFCSRRCGEFGLAALAAVARTDCAQLAQHVFDGRLGDGMHRIVRHAPAGTQQDVVREAAIGTRIPAAGTTLADLVRVFQATLLCWKRRQVRSWPGQGQLLRADRDLSATAQARCRLTLSTALSTPLPVTESVTLSSRYRSFSPW